LAYIAPHARGLELEHARRLARAQQIERLLVVEGDLLAADPHAAVALDEAQRLVEDREVRETEEVELQDAELLELLVLVLRLDGVHVALRALKGHELRERLAVDDDARGVRPGRAHEALDLLREVEESRDVRLLLERPQLADHAAGFGELDAEGDRLRDAVGLTVRHAEHARDVTDRGPREHGVERPDLRDTVAPVLLGDVGDDLVATGVHRSEEHTSELQSPDHL